MNEIPFLIPFPCGCVSDCIGILEDVITCPWCEATFLFGEFKLWLREQDPVQVMSPPKKLIKIAEQVFELYARCKCGAAVLQQVMSGRKGDCFHFSERPPEAQLLWD